MARRHCHGPKGGSGLQTPSAPPPTHTHVQAQAPQHTQRTSEHRHTGSRPGSAPSLARAPQARPLCSPAMRGPLELWGLQQSGHPTPQEALHPLRPPSTPHCGSLHPHPCSGHPLAAARSDGISAGMSPAPGIAALAPSFRQDTPKRVWVRVSKIRTPKFHSMSHSQAVTTPAQVHNLSAHGSGAKPAQAPGSRQWGAGKEGGKGGEAPWGLGGMLRGGLCSRSSRPRWTEWPAHP